MSASAFDILWSDLGHAGAPGALRVPAVGARETEHARIRDAVYDNLRERGLFVGGGLEPELRDRLDVLAAADVLVECEALLDVAEAEPLRAVAAARGGDGVLAAQPRQTIGLSAIRATEVIEAVVGVLPELEPGPGFGVSLPAAVLGSGLRDPLFDGPQAGECSAVYQRQIREVLAVQARPVLGAGQFCVRVREGSRLRRLGGLSWFATDVGAYLGIVAPGRCGEDWMSVAPADRARLAGRLADILDG